MLNDIENQHVDYYKSTLRDCPNRGNIFYWKSHDAKYLFTTEAFSFSIYTGKTSCYSLFARIGVTINMWFVAISNGRISVYQITQINGEVKSYL